jgi:hypothetical protein
LLITSVYSLIFALSYQNIPLYKKKINEFFFLGSQSFANRYFDFFWGNMHRMAKYKVTGASLSTAYYFRRETEIMQVNRNVDLKMEAAVKSGIIKTAEEYLKLHNSFRKAAVNDTYILYAESKVAAVGSAFFS